MHRNSSTSCICIVVIAVFFIATDAFSTRAFTKSTSRTALSMVVQVPTSNVSLDDMMLAESVMVEDVAMDSDEDTDDLSTIDTMEIKRRLLDLLPRMTGQPEEYNLVETYVNTLEDRYTPVQTLDFLNLAMSGEWQLLFSTNLLGAPRADFRLRDLYQKIEANSLNGTVVNVATWDWAEDHEGALPTSSFDAFGTFSIECSYSINQGSRMVLDLNDHVINLTKGSVVPKDVKKLVALLHRAIPKELFEPDDHAMDTTYLDGDLRIVRMAGPKFESVRDIFIRRGSMQINPV